MKKILSILIIAALVVTQSAPVFACTVKEKISEKVYTVTFNSNGGSAVDSQKVKYNNLVQKPQDPVRSGYTFKGWYYKEKSFDFNKTKVKRSMTIKAKWNKNSTVDRSAYHAAVDAWYDMHAALNADTRHTADSITAAKNLLNNHTDIGAHGNAVIGSYDKWTDQRYLNSAKTYTQSEIDAWTTKLNAVVAQAKALLVVKPVDFKAYKDAVDAWYDMHAALNKDTKHTADSITAAKNKLNNHADISAHGKAVVASYDKWTDQRYLNAEKIYTQDEIDAWAKKINAVVAEAKALLIVKPDTKTSQKKDDNKKQDKKDNEKVTITSTTPSAVVEKQSGNKNNLTITITETYSDGTTRVIATKTFLINNNAADTYKVGDYKVYVDTKGNTQVRSCYFVK